MLLVPGLVVLRHRLGPGGLLPIEEEITLRDDKKSLGKAITVRAPGKQQTSTDTVREASALITMLIITNSTATATKYIICHHTQR